MTTRIFISLLALVLIGIPMPMMLTQAEAPAADPPAEEDSDVSGTGFYRKIYEDAVKRPTEDIDAALKQRFGIDLDLKPKPSRQQGQYAFWDLYQDPLWQKSREYQPTLKDDLRADCLRIKMGQIGDEEVRLRILKNRLQERQIVAETGTVGTASSAGLDQIEYLQRIVGQIDQQSRDQIEAQIKALPNLDGPVEQDVLLACYQNFTEDVSFESRLQTLLSPLRRQLKVMQTFINGDLDDFTSDIPFADALFGTTFPRYDLLFDLDIIDFIFFGTSFSMGISGPGDPRQSGGGDVGETASERAALGQVSGQTITSATQVGTSQPQRFGEISSRSVSSRQAFPPLNVPTDSGSTGFGASKDTYGGPYCSAREGLRLDFSTLGYTQATPQGRGTLVGGPVSNQSPDVASGSGTVYSGPAGTSPTGGGLSSSSGGNSNGGATIDGRPIVPSLAGEDDLNLEALCENLNDTDTPGLVMKLAFCINVTFDKVGKTWQKRREDCISCRIAEMNQLFEEQILAQSVRPHKNTGTIMESSVCEDGYGDKLDQFIYREWVPVKFYPDICYPKAGVTDEKYAQLVGYPEVVSRMKKGSDDFDCEVEFKDPDAVKRCTSAIGGGKLSYDNFRKAYLDRNLFWKSLVGRQGQAERAQHDFLYRLGQTQPWYEENEVPVAQDLKVRLDALKKRMADIQRIPADEGNLRLEKMICLRGYYIEGSPNIGSIQCGGGDTIRAWEKEVNQLRDQVMDQVKNWNDLSRDFNRDNQCGPFDGHSSFDKFKDFVLDRIPGSGYYLQTDFRRTQTPEEQVTRQITANSGISDLSDLFSAINSEVKSLTQAKKADEQNYNFETQQEAALMLPKALGQEFKQFKSNMLGFTNWWAEMVDQKNFKSSGGKSINALESFLEKTK
ncbi:MAG: hypothetical protein Q8P95_02665 [bacterium]|nr:hypothetical protein [bacterium]